MRALFSLVALVLFVAIVWLGIRYSDSIYCRLILNKASYEFLNRKEEKAINRVIGLLERRPNYKPALEAAILWLARGRQFDRARALARDYATTLTLSSLARYHLAICAYEKGTPKEVVGLFETLTSLTKQSTEISTPLVHTYLAMARGDYETARSQLERAGSLFENTLLYHSLFGRVCFAQGDVVRATDELGHAVKLGAENPRTRLLLAACMAMEGNLSDMERLLDQLTAEGHDAYTQARSEIQTLLESSKATGPFLSSTEQTIQRARVFNLRLALAAVKSRQNHESEALDILAALSHDFPERIGPATRRGLFYEREGHPDMALKFYRQESNRLFLAAYKTATLGSSPATAPEKAVMKKFLTAGSVVFDASTMNPSAGAPASRGWALTSSGEVWQTFSVSSTGRYAIDLIARGDAAGGIWPIVELLLDSKMAGEQYINSPVYDLFEIHVPLLAGTHWLRVIYVNNTLEPGIQGDRNLYLDKVIIRPDPN